MPSPYFVNPLFNPIFLPFVLEIALLFCAAFFILFAKNTFSFQNLFKTKIGQIYLGWALLVPIFVIGVFFGRIAGLLLLSILLLLAIREIVRVARLPRAYLYALSGFALGSIAVASFAPQFFFSLPIFYFVVLTLIPIQQNDSKQGLYHASISLFFSIWLIFGLSHFILLSDLSNSLDATRALPLLVIVASSLSDIGAFVFGKTFHKLHFFDSYKIASNISPNKTYIGIIGHVAGAALGVFIMYGVLHQYLPAYHWIFISVLIGVFGLAGGLTNSLFKRYYAVKDSSNLIPGHGGVLDRMDSIVRVVVVLYYYLLAVL